MDKVVNGKLIQQVILSDADGNPYTASGGTSVAPASSTVAAVAITNASALALASNSSRLGAMFYNDSSNKVYLLLKPTGDAAADNASIALPAGGAFVLGKGDYTGNVYLFGTFEGGNLLVTEFVSGV